MFLALKLGRSCCRIGGRLSGREEEVFESGDSVAVGGQLLGFGLGYVGHVLDVHDDFVGDG